MAAMTDPFWIDAEYDREAASDGVSRYGAYIRQAKFEPWTDDDKAVELAVFAWQQATGPVMAPGYVRRHHRVLSARLERSDWDGSLVASVELVTQQPGPLQYLRSGDHDLWRDWPRESSFSGDPVYYEPGGQDLASSAYLLTSARLLFTVPSVGLPEPPGHHPETLKRPSGELTDACRDSVAAVVRELNRIAGPVLKAVENG